MTGSASRFIQDNFFTRSTQQRAEYYTPEEGMEKLELLKETYGEDSQIYLTISEAYSQLMSEDSLGGVNISLEEQNAFAYALAYGAYGIEAPSADTVEPELSWDTIEPATQPDYGCSFDEIEPQIYPASGDYGDSDDSDD